MNLNYKKEEDLSLCEILENCPRGLRLYSPIFGSVMFETVLYSEPSTPDLILVRNNEGKPVCFDKTGRLSKSTISDCSLFPSKDKQSWDAWIEFAEENRRFDYRTLKPFDKILVKNKFGHWNCATFSHFFDYIPLPRIITTNESSYHYAIPYNEDTKYLVGTSLKEPEYYHYWNIFDN